MAGIIMPFIGVAHGDPVLREGPELLDQAVVQLLVPFAFKESLGLGPTMNEFRAVTPLGIRRIGQGDLGGVAAVPAIFGQADLEYRGFPSERRQWRAGLGAGH